MKATSSCSCLYYSTPRYTGDQEHCDKCACSTVGLCARAFMNTCNILPYVLPVLSMSCFLIMAQVIERHHRGQNLTGVACHVHLITFYTKLFWNKQADERSTVTSVRNIMHITLPCVVPLIRTSYRAYNAHNFLLRHKTSQL